jgi:DNA-binding transcriptional regulator YiaG
MAKPRLSKELFLMGLTPRHFEEVLSRGFQTGEDIKALRELLKMSSSAFADALGIPETLLAELESQAGPPSPKFTRRLIMAAEDPGTFIKMT